MKFPPINLWSYPKMLNNSEQLIKELALMLEVPAHTEAVKDAVLELLRYKDDVEMSMADEEPLLLSQRGQEWVEFSNEVLRHVEEYTVPQYGDKGDDNVTDYTPKDCVLQIKKYATRFESNQRFGQERLDLLKTAHYACLAHTKL